MWEKHKFETIFTYNDVMNVQYVLVQGFGSREIEHSMGINAYFGPRRTNRPHATPNYGTRKSRFEVDYYRKTYFSPEKVAHNRKICKNKSIINLFL